MKQIKQENIFFYGKRKQEFLKSAIYLLWLNDLGNNNANFHLETSNK